jgi:hypothetical protein
LTISNWQFQNEQAGVIPNPRDEKSLGNLLILFSNFTVREGSTRPYAASFNKWAGNADIDQCVDCNGSKQGYSGRVSGEWSINTRF